MTLSGSMPLGDRTALITGGSRGLGLSLGQGFVRAGAHVAILARPSAVLDAALDSLDAARVAPTQRVTAIPADLADLNSLPSVVRRVEAALGPLDVLVNNAAAMGPIGPLADTSMEEWQSAIAVNLIAPVALMQAVLHGMRDRRRGKIINVSGGGATGSRPNFSAYACAKTALVRATEIVADEVKTFGIDVNAIAPGAMNTRLLDAVLEAGPDKVGAIEYRRALEQQASGGAPPARAVELAVWLASPASDGITGRLLSAIWDPWADLPAQWAELEKTDIYTLRRIVPADRGRA